MTAYVATLASGTDVHISTNHVGNVYVELAQPDGHATFTATTRTEARQIAAALIDAADTEPT